LLGYVSAADDIKAKGVDEIVCVSVNDPFVMEAWGQAHNATGKVRLFFHVKGAFCDGFSAGFIFLSRQGTVPAP